MPITAKQQRELIIEESFKQHQALRDTIQRCIGELYNLRPSDAHTYLYALDHIFYEYGEDKERMNQDGLIMLVPIKRN